MFNYDIIQQKRGGEGEGEGQVHLFVVIGYSSVCVLTLFSLQKIQKQATQLYLELLEVRENLISQPNVWTRAQSLDLCKSLSILREDTLGNLNEKITPSSSGVRTPLQS